VRRRVKLMTSFPRETHDVISGPAKDIGYNQFVVKVKNDPEIMEL
jgi:hypothetical protein